MREIIEDFISIVCIFGTGYMLLLIGHGFGY
jgi:hypothetical protein